MIKTGIIYKATSKTTKKCYIEQTIQKYKKRKGRHTGDAFNPNTNAYNTHFSRAIRKYGKKDFEWEIMYENVPKANLKLLEIWNISIHNSYMNGYNSTEGGEGSTGHTASKETRAKISKAIKSIGTNISKEGRRKISKMSRGEGNPRAKLTELKVKEICKKYATGEYTRLELANEHNVTCTSIDNIVLNKTWVHIRAFYSHTPGDCEG